MLDTTETAGAAAAHRGKVIDRILRQMRQEVLASRMMQAVLEELCATLNGAGAAILDLLAPPGAGCVLHGAGKPPGPLAPAMVAALDADYTEPVGGCVAGHPLLACPSYTSFGDRAGLYVWRPHGAPPWTAEDAHLLSSVTAIVRLVLEHAAVQRELALQSRTDPLTGLLNRRTFFEDVTRRIDRLHHDGAPGTLMLVAVDHFRRLNDQCGQDSGDQALVLIANLLRGIVRPADLVARLAATVFAIWLDGSDELTAAERAEHLRLEAPSQLAEALPLTAPDLSTSIGIAARHPRDSQTLEETVRRAEAALTDAKRFGRAQWRVAAAPAHP